MAFGTVTQSAFLTVSSAFSFFKEAGGSAVVITLNPKESVSFKFHVDAAGTTDGLQLELLQGHRISNGNTLDGVTSTSDIELDTAADGFSTDDDLNGTYIILTSGDRNGEGRLIVDSVAADDGVNLSHALSGAAAAGDSYALYNFVPHRIRINPQTTITSNAQNNADFVTDWRSGQYVAVVARATGATDAHRVRLSYQVDGIT